MKLLSSIFKSTTAPSLHGRVTKDTFKDIFKDIPKGRENGNVDSKELHKLISEGSSATNALVNSDGNLNRGNIVKTALKDFARNNIPIYDNQSPQTLNAGMMAAIQTLPPKILDPLKERLAKLGLNENEINEVLELNISDPENVVKAFSDLLDRLESFFNKDSNHILKAICYLNQSAFGENNTSSTQLSIWEGDNLPSIYSSAQEVERTESSCFNYSIVGEKLVIFGNRKSTYSKGASTETLNADFTIEFNKNGQISSTSCSFYKD